MARLPLGLILAAAGLAACTRSIQPPDLGELYSRTAQYHGVERNPIIVIPGILGSKLVDAESGKIVWGAFTGEYANPGTAEGARLVALPMREGAPLRELVDGGQQAGALDRLQVRFLGLPIFLNAYATLLVSLGAGGYLDEQLGLMGEIDYGDDHFTCFQFAYDWRRDNIENARRLKQFILEKKAYVEAEHRKRGRDPGDVKFDIIAHSMGGLVTRWFLRYGDAALPADGSAPPLTWDGARYVERAVLVGTPNAGAAGALMELANGVSFAAILPTYPPEVLGTMPSIYQLLHRPRHASQDLGDVLDPAVWDQHGWGLANPDDDVLEQLLPDVADAGQRRRIAREHLGKCLARARAFQTALDLPAATPAGTEMFLFVGDAVSTVRELAPTGDRLRASGFGPGDGTVLRTSALMDERAGGEWHPQLRSPIAWSRVHFLFDDHLGMTRNPAFTDNILYLLLEEPR